MDFLSDFLTGFVKQLQSPTLGFLIGGMVAASLGSRLAIPDAVYKFIVFMLLMKVGLTGGQEIRNANLVEMLLPALFAVVTGILIVFLGRYTLCKLPHVKMEDGLATAGLFGAVSGSTFAAALTLLETEQIPYEAWSAALYPFMDIPALVTAIVLASIYTNKQEYRSKREYYGEQGIVAEGYPSKQPERVKVWPIVQESLQGSALSALLLGLVLGLATQPESVYTTFYDPLFRGLLSVLMLIMGMEAWARLNELRKVAHWYTVYSVVAPLFHGLIAFGFGMIAHYLTGFSLGGVVVLAVMAASSSDISGPPTLRAGIPAANPSAYIGASTAVGTPVAIALAIPLYIGLAQALTGGG
ncbi:sodium-dependent bicarbonate transport family permease [Spirulina sp. CCNP1310]|uniref:sodium-dependent bicarbonate transport family permease n=1 Tax=Spirulina sp. CCNP1310 TaxID=3110249 RepID=UPI002B380A3F|nr:sodium-dependent bicarbonate transport family permease [Spirulina sp. CCNP1310]